MRKLFQSRFVRFGIVGGSGVAVNYVCYVLFHDVLGIYDLLGLVLAIELSIINNFVLNERWTFRDRAEKGAGTYLKRFLAFNLTSGAVAFSVQVLNQWIETRIFNVWDKAALMIGISLGALINYFVCNYLIFRRKPETAEPAKTSETSAITWNTAGILLAFLPAAILRFVHPLDFPPFTGQEGLWNLGPKQALQLGNPVAYGLGHVFLSPWHFVTTLALYRAFGPSLVLSRWLGGLFGLGVVLFTYLLAKRFFGTRVAILSALLCAYNSLEIFGSRVAELEIEASFYILGTLYFWFTSNRKLTWISGLFLAASLLVKMYSLALFPTLVLGQLFISREDGQGVPLWRRISVRQWITLALGAFLAAAGYFLISSLDPAHFEHIWLKHSINREEPFEIFSFAKNFLLFFPELIILAALGLILGVIRRNWPTFVIGGWFLSTFLLISAQTYHAPTYYMPVIPGIMAMAALALTLLLAPPQAGAVRRYLLYGVVALICVWQPLRLLPMVKRSAELNRSIVAASDWLNQHLKPGEPVLSSYITAMLIQNPTVPLLESLEEKWQAEQESHTEQPFPWTRYCFLVDRQLGQGDAERQWAIGFLEANTIKVYQDGPIMVLERRTAEGSPAGAASQQNP